MKRRWMINAIAFFLLTLSTILGLQLVQAQSRVNLTISAAISLSNALNEIKPFYERSHPNVRLTYNFGSSGALQQQIEQGAPADIFFSAATRQMEALQSKNLLLAGTRRNLLGNQVVLITPVNSNLGVASFQNLTNNNISRIAMGEPRSVPAGQYAQEVLNSLNLYQRIQSKLVLANNVRQVLTFVETGNADAGIVYATDAQQSNRVKIVATAPAGSHSPIIYPIAAIQSTRNPAAARAFIQFLSSSQARQVFNKYGFSNL